MRTWININLLQICSREPHALRDVRETGPGSLAGAEGKERHPSLDFRQLNLQFNLAKTELVAFV